MTGEFEIARFDDAPTIVARFFRDGIEALLRPRVVADFHRETGIARIHRRIAGIVGFDVVGDRDRLIEAVQRQLDRCQFELARHVADRLRDEGLLGGALGAQDVVDVHTLAIPLQILFGEMIRTDHVAAVMCLLRLLPERDELVAVLVVGDDGGHRRQRRGRSDVRAARHVTRPSRNGDDRAQHDRHRYESGRSAFSHSS